MLMIVDDVLSFDAGFKMIYYGFNGYLMEDKNMMDLIDFTLKELKDIIIIWYNLQIASLM